MHTTASHHASISAGYSPRPHALARPGTRDHAGFATVQFQFGSSAQVMQPPTHGVRRGAGPAWGGDAPRPTPSRMIPRHQCAPDRVPGCAPGCPRGETPRQPPPSASAMALRTGLIRFGKCRFGSSMQRNPARADAMLTLAPPLVAIRLGCEGGPGRVWPGRVWPGLVRVPGQCVGEPGARAPNLPHATSPKPTHRRHPHAYRVDT